MIKKILNNAILMSWASYFVNFGSSLIVFPLLLKVYDDTEVSFWFLAATIIGFAMMADTGFGSALQRAAAYFKAGAEHLPKDRKEYDNIKEIEDSRPNEIQLVNLLATTKKIYLILTLISLAFVMIGGTAIVWNLMSNSGHRKDLWLAFLVLIPDTYVVINTIRWSSFLKGFNYIAVEARITSLIGAFKVIAFIVLLSFGAKPLYLMLFMLIFDIFRFFYIRYFIKKWYAENIQPAVNANARYSKRIFKSLWAASWRLGGIFWGNYFVEQGDSIIIAQIPDQKLMASFLITKRVLEILRNIAQTTFYAKIPVVYELAAQKKILDLKKFSSGYMFIGLLILLAGYLLIILFGNNLLEILQIEKRLVPFSILLFICLTMILDMHSSFHAGIYTSTNHIPFLIPSLVSGLIIFLVGFKVVGIYSIFGVVLTRFIVQFSFNNWYAMVLSLKLLKWPLYKYIYEFPLFGFQFSVKTLKRIINK